MKTEFESISNPRTPEGGFKYPDLKCHSCGCLTSAYLLLGVEYEIDMTESVVLCKGCLDKGIHMINKTILT